MITGMVNELTGNRSPHVDVEWILPWFDKHWKDQSCPICGNHSWQIEDSPYRLDPVRFQKNGMYIISHSTRLVIPVMCETCGYIVMFDAAKTGVLWFESENETDNE